mmetsp:Transcript_5756/g.10454  ORF Transcript_5756/g.10454 Transcript_5756/m.10454 type:complete len:315 (+) Transcript_5756:1475-2419(+)
MSFVSVLQQERLVHVRNVFVPAENVLNGQLHFGRNFDSGWFLHFHFFQLRLWLLVVLGVVAAALGVTFRGPEDNLRAGQDFHIIVLIVAIVVGNCGELNLPARHLLLLLTRQRRVRRRGICICGGGGGGAGNEINTDTVLLPLGDPLINDLDTLVYPLILVLDPNDVSLEDLVGVGNSLLPLVLGLLDLADFLLSDPRVEQVSADGGPQVFAAFRVIRQERNLVGAAVGGANVQLSLHRHQHVLLPVHRHVGNEVAPAQHYNTLLRLDLSAVLEGGDLSQDSMPLHRLHTTLEPCLELDEVSHVEDFPVAEIVE